MKVAINGFGRIGRLILRAFWERSTANFDIVAINDLQNLDTALHLLKYDSAHGHIGGNVQKIAADEFEMNANRFTYLSEKCPDKLPWRDLKIDLVLECTGMLKTRSQCEAHIRAGASRVLVSRPVDDADNTIVYGVNHKSLDFRKDFVVSNASCTTNCLAHIVKAVHQWIGIERGFATTIHSYTGDQRLVDTNHTDLRRSRAAACSMIPTSTGATKTIERIFPELGEKLSGLSIRVPTPNVSMVDFTFVAAKKITENDLRQVIVDYSASTVSQLSGDKNIFSYTDDQLVSCDFNTYPHSAIVDIPLLKVIDGNLGHVVAWYDNEWGFSHRMLDTAALIAVQPAGK